MSNPGSWLPSAAGPATLKSPIWSITEAVSEADSWKPFGKALIAQLPALRRYAIALTGNLSAADDLVQDCIERALRQADQLREPGRLPAWLRSIVHNLYIDEIRRRRGRGIEEDVSDLTDDLALSVTPTDHGEITSFVRAVNTLSAEHRQILLLVGLEGLNYREIAEELKIPIGTVMSRLARARERLRFAIERGSPSGAEITPLRRKAER
jgi:RNA polymerase sigma-70 factor (ECF subfamily)